MALLDAAAAYVFSFPGSEARGRSPLWDDCARHRPNQCFEVVTATSATVTIRRASLSAEEIALSDQGALSDLFDSFPGVYIDISGLGHHVWAPMLRAAFARDFVFAVYAEPEQYRKHPSPTSRTEYDLSAGFRGIEPLPGFAKLRGPDEEKDAVFVALLGFEGKRASHLAVELDPAPKMFAIMGVPGFRAEYPQITSASNDDFLAEFGVYPNIRYAAASCPFEAFDVLGDIQRDCGGKYMYIAPVGTKPHAIGAILYALKHGNTTEIMYDHPIRKSGRTQGIGTVHIYALKPCYVAP